MLSTNSGKWIVLLFELLENGSISTCLTVSVHHRVGDHTEHVGGWEEAGREAADFSIFLATF